MNACMNSCTYEFISIWIHKTSEFSSIWIHRVYEFISSNLWITCVIRHVNMCNLGTLAETYAAPVSRRAPLLCCFLCHLVQHQMACLEVLLWLCPLWVTFDTESTRGCVRNELMQLEKSRNRMDHIANTGITHHHHRFWVDLRLIFSACPNLSTSAHHDSR